MRCLVYARFMPSADWFRASGGVVRRARTEDDAIHNLTVVLEFLSNDVLGKPWMMGCVSSRALGRQSSPTVTTLSHPVFCQAWISLTSPRRRWPLGHTLLSQTCWRLSMRWWLFFKTRAISLHISHSIVLKRPTRQPPSRRDFCQVAPPRARACHRQLLSSSQVPSLLSK